MWNPDGWESPTRIGLLTPHADVGPESELQAITFQRRTGRVHRRQRFPCSRRDRVARTGARTPGADGNQVLFWVALRAAKAPVSVNGYGGLFTAMPLT